MPVTDKKTPNFVHCGDCGHSWIGFYLPMSIKLFIRFKNIVCPMCASKKVFIGKGSNKVLIGQGQ